MTYTYYAVEFTTGRVVTELPLAAFSGGRHLVGGPLQASLILADLTDTARRELLEVTTPLKYSVAADRNGVCVGEWLIWKRSRAYGEDVVQLVGQEPVSYLDSRQVGAANYVNVDQLTIARNMATQAFAGAPSGGAGSVAVTIPAVLSGVLRTRRYEAGEATTGQRLSELSEVIGGFDYLIDPEWVAVGGIRYVRRTMRLQYPMAGIDQPSRFDLSGPDGQGGSALGLAVAEDGGKLASAATAVGSGEGSDKVQHTATTDALTDAGFPYSEISRSWTSVSETGTIIGHAQELLAVSQILELPPTVTVLADSEPAVGEYSLGDRIWVVADPSPTFPDGYTERVRILGWTLAPPPSGPETVALEVTTYAAGG